MAGVRPARPSHTSEVSWTLDEAVRRARKEGSPVVRLDHVLLAAAAHPEGAAMLSALGADVARAVRLAPPERLGALHVAIREQRVRRDRALKAGDYEISAAPDVAELAARQSLAEALSEWVASWAAAPPGG